jgi:ubiquinone/menaquinone biosynthesis C-methylase UbiE
MFGNKDVDKMPGHWLLAKMGKKVLRPGGRELTMKLMDELSISGSDDVVEFAPGLGYTASLALKYHPLSYTGIEAEEDAVKLLQSKIKGKNISFIQGNAARTSLPENSRDRVYGEAMLTMQTDSRKTDIIREAFRILKKGGLYGIHELGLSPDSLSGADKAQIQKELAQVIRVNARPLTAVEWRQQLESNGFAVKKILKAPMHLLEPARMIDDEGFFRAVGIGFRVLTNAGARKRLLAMRRIFHKYGNRLNAVAIIAEKI